MASNTTGTITPSPLTKYVALLVMLFGIVGFTYFAKFIPSNYGVIGILGSITALFGTVAHDFEDSASNIGQPPWITFAVITVTSAVEGAAGYLTGTSVVTSGAFIVWVIVVLAFVYHAVMEDAGKSVSPFIESWLTTGTGLAVSFLTWYTGQTDLTIGAVLTTLVTLVPQWIHIGTDGSIAPANPGIPTVPSAPIA